MVDLEIPAFSFLCCGFVPLLFLIMCGLLMLCVIAVLILAMMGFLIVRVVFPSFAGRL